MTSRSRVVLSATWLLVCAGIAPSVHAQATFSSKVDSVTLDVIVTARGRPLLGLGAGDFEVRDNGVLQQASLLAAGSFPLDVVLALDTSSSLSGERLRTLEAASRDLVGALRAEDRVALFTFNHAVARRQALTQDTAALAAAFDGVTPSGDTALVDAMYAAIAGADAGGRRTLLIVFSDGIDTASWLTSEAVVQAARQSGTVIYAVSTVEAGRTPVVLRDVAKATGGEVITVDSGRLQTVFLDILNDFRNRYLLSYTHRTTPPPGWHKVEVRVKRRGAVVRTREGYFVGTGGGSSRLSPFSIGLPRSAHSSYPPISARTFGRPACFSNSATRALVCSASQLQYATISLASPRSVACPCGVASSSGVISTAPGRCPRR